jgi:hypothetical protein
VRLQNESRQTAGESSHLVSLEHLRAKDHETVQHHDEDHEIQRLPMDGNA